MKKTIKILIFISIFLMLILPAFSFVQAATTFAILHPTPTSVTIKVGGLNLNQTYNFKLSLDNQTFRLLQVQADAAGTARPDFLNLFPGKTYDLNVTDLVFSFVGNFKFTTQSAATPNMVISSFTDKSVTMGADGLIPSQTYKFIISSSTEVVYEKIINNVTRASDSFSNLTPDKTYNLNLKQYDPSSGILTDGATPIQFTTKTAAVPTMTVDPSDITTISVKVLLSGLDSHQEYKLLISTSTKLVEEKIILLVEARPYTFSNLASGTAYNLNLKKYDPSTGFLTDFGVPSIPFTTKSTSTPTMTFTPASPTTFVTINATGLTPSQKYVFAISYEGNVVDARNSEVTATNETATTPFSDLTPGKNYVVTLFSSKDLSKQVAPPIFFTTKTPEGGGTGDTGGGNETPPSTGGGGLVPCDNSSGNLCDFNALMKLVNTVIKFILYDMVIPIAAIMFVYAGFELVTSGGSTEKRGIAKKVFTNAVIGLIIAVAAFLIIRTILSILGYSGSWIGFNPIQ